MNICESIKTFDINNIFYLDPIKNTVIDNSNFPTPNKELFFDN